MHRMPEKQDFSVILLAGGESRRMGRNKALLPWHGEPLIQHIAKKLATITDDIVLVTNTPREYEFLGLKMVTDCIPHGGSIVGLCSGLESVKNDWALAVACDMPLLNLDLVKYMASLREEYDVVVPILDGREEPLHAFYRKSCLGSMKTHIRKGDRRIISFYSEVRVRRVEEDEIRQFDPNHLSFLNANTPDEWDKIKRLMEDSIP
jgi:molybdopterin-guanine dinucleotide biosynthesis protein A